MRDVTRDVVRGLNVLEMETVNLTQTVLFHASVDEHTVTYADSVFPTFAFLAGMSPTPLARNAGFLGLGLAYNTLPVMYQRKAFKPRYFGVLQRLAVSSILFNELAPAKASSSLLGLAFPIGATAVWTAASTFLAKDPAHPFARPEDSAQSALDAALVGKSTMYRAEYDPEGSLGSIMTAVSMWIGSWFASAMLTQRDALIVGAGLTAAGFASAKVLPEHWPVSKPWWTPSFTLIAGGFSILKYTLIELAIPYLPVPVVYGLSCLGRRSVEVYAASGILHSALRGLGLSDKIKEFLARYIGTTGSDLVYVGASNALMTLLAVQLVENHIRLRIF